MLKPVFNLTKKFNNKLFVRAFSSTFKNNNVKWEEFEKELNEKDKWLSEPMVRIHKRLQDGNPEHKKEIVPSDEYTTDPFVPPIRNIPEAFDVKVERSHEELWNWNTWAHLSPYEDKYDFEGGEGWSLHYPIILNNYEDYAVIGCSQQCYEDKPDLHYCRFAYAVLHPNHTGRCNACGLFFYSPTQDDRYEMNKQMLKENNTVIATEYILNTDFLNNKDEFLEGVQFLYRKTEDETFNVSNEELKSNEKKQKEIRDYALAYALKTQYQMLHDLAHDLFMRSRRRLIDAPFTPTAMEVNQVLEIVKVDGLAKVSSELEKYDPTELYMKEEINKLDSNLESAPSPALSRKAEATFEQFLNWFGGEDAYKAAFGNIPENNKELYTQMRKFLTQYYTTKFKDLDVATLKSFVQTLKTENPQAFDSYKQQYLAQK